MTRVPSGSQGPARKATPDIYSLLLLVGIVFLVVGCAIAFWNLQVNYGLKFSQLFTSVKIPQ